MTIFNAETTIPNPRVYTVKLWNECDESRLSTYLSADYTNPLSENPDDDCVCITYINGKNPHLTSIELPTDNPELMAEAVRICKSIESELRMLDNLMIEIVEDNDTENIYAENYGCFRS